MKIKRNVNGQEMEFELTRDEMCKAFWEQEREYYKEDIQSVYEEKGLMLTDEQFRVAVGLYEKYLSYNDGWRDAAEEAIYVALQND
jgi:hypothetical protein